MLSVHTEAPSVVNSRVEHLPFLGALVLVALVSLVFVSLFAG